MTCPVCGSPSMILSERLAARRAELGLGKKPLPCPTHAWERIQASLAEEDDLLDPSTPIEVIDERLRSIGADPEAVASMGVAFVARLRSELKKSTS